MQSIKNLRGLLALGVTGVFLTGCTHTGAVHYANDVTVNPDADIATESLLNEEGITSLGAGPGGYR